MKLLAIIILLSGLRLAAQCVRVNLHVLIAPVSVPAVDKLISVAYTAGGSPTCGDTTAPRKTDANGEIMLSLPVDANVYLTVSDSKFGMRLCDESSIEVSKVIAVGKVSGALGSTPVPKVSPGELILFVRRPSFLERLHATLLGT